jgi:membrane-associated phospholipid phosphatase
MVALFPALFHLFSPRKAMTGIMFFCFAGYTTAILSLAYNEPRPYWVYGSIDSLHPSFMDCGRGYGNPPYHQVFGIGYLYLCFNLFKHYPRLRKALQWVFIVATLFAGFERVYVGEHFIHQVVIGWVYGYIFCVFMMLIDSYITDIIKTTGFAYHT